LGFKHPTPDDFFRTMENVAGEDLSWFWRGWFEYNWRFDQESILLNIKKMIQNKELSTIENFEKNAHANCFRYCRKVVEYRVKLVVQKCNWKFGNKILLRK
jgi:hypothetical protein